MIHPCNNQEPDTNIILLLAENDDAAWAHLYDKYASIMYGIVYKMVGEENVAEEILVEVFIDLKRKKMLAGVRTALCHSIIRHTHRLTLSHLVARGLKPVRTQSENGSQSAISTLYFELAAINQLETTSSLAKQAILLNLRAEFNRFRNI